MVKTVGEGQNLVKSIVDDVELVVDLIDLDLFHTG